MAFAKAKKSIVHGGRVRAKGEVFEVRDRVDRMGQPVEGSADAEAKRLMDEGYAEKASSEDVKKFREKGEPQGGESPAEPAATSVSANAPEPAPPAGPVSHGG